MPFVLAHPAAVLPFRRWCPKYLSLPALVCGSLSIDTAYLFGPLRVDEFAHRLTGSLVYGLPAGLALVGFLVLCRPLIPKLLPAAPARALGAFLHQPPGSFWVVCVSVLIGALTHLLCDALTHKDGYFVQQIPAFRTVAFSISGRSVRVSHLLWYSCSFLGIAWVCLAAQGWRGARGERGKLAVALLAAAFTMPIAVIHHSLPGARGALLVAGLSGCLFLAILWFLGTRMRKGTPGPAVTRPKAGS